jgi:hypothetical protein
MVAFYNKADQELYKNYQYLPQEQYRLGLNLPKDTQAETVNTTFGIPATNAFTNSDNTIFSPSGNAFGYGSPVSEVNVRTFNPQSLPGPKTPGGLPAQQMYNIASKDLNNPFNRSAMSTTFPTRTAKEVMDYANEPIMDYKEQYGAQGQYISPYDDTVDQSKYTTTIGSFPSRAFFNRLRNKGFNIAENLPYIGTAARILKGFLPQQEDRGPGGGTYGIAGLSDAQKTQYNALAKEGFLFDGPSGIKTLTGKNFAAKNYLENQLNLYNKEFADMTEEEIEELKNDPKRQFKYKQYLESSAMYKTNKAAEEKRKQEFEKPGGTQEQVANLQKEIDTGKYSGGSDFAQKNQAAVGGGEKGRAANTDNNRSTGTSQGYTQHYIKGGLVSLL